MPLLLLGGGGYTVRNVAKCWTYETACALDLECNLSNDIPEHDYLNCYQNEDYKLLRLPPSSIGKNKNSEQMIHRLREKISENIKHVEHGPKFGLTLEDFKREF